MAPLTTGSESDEAMTDELLSVLGNDLYFGGHLQVVEMEESIANMMRLK